MDWLLDAARNILLGWVPLWVWIIVAGLVAGWAWRVFGPQGLVGAVVAILSLGAYRQGWRDRGEGRGPIVPVPPDLPTIASPDDAVAEAERQTGQRHTYVKRS